MLRRKGPYRDSRQLLGPRSNLIPAETTLSVQVPPRNWLRAGVCPVLFVMVFLLHALR